MSVLNTTYLSGPHAAGPPFTRKVAPLHGKPGPTGASRYRENKDLSPECSAPLASRQTSKPRRQG
jgi:hypothetical protein